VAAEGVLRQVVQQTDQSEWRCFAQTVVDESDCVCGTVNYTFRAAKTWSEPVEVLLSTR
jgi:hypothetical protein